MPWGLRGPRLGILRCDPSSLLMDASAAAMPSVMWEGKGRDKREGVEGPASQACVSRTDFPSAHLLAQDRSARPRLSAAEAVVTL